MATVAALFGSQAEATKALDALAESQFEDVETTVYEPSQLAGDAGNAISGVETSAADTLRAGVVSSAAGEIAEGLLADLDDEEVSDYFVREVKEHGAILVVANVDDERATALEQFFQDQGGRTTEED